VSISRHLAHRPERSSPSAARPVTVHRRPSSSTPAVGWSCRMSHQPGSPSAQPFITSVTRLGPSWKYPNTTLLWVTERPPPRGGQSQGAPAVRLRTPQADAAPRDTVQTAVHVPCRADEPAWRKSRLLSRSW